MSTAVLISLKLELEVEILKPSSCFESFKSAVVQIKSVNYPN